MMQHSEIQDRLHDFVDGELPGEEREAVLDHLGRCADCQAELEGLISLQAQARALPRAVTPPRDLWPEIAARLDAGGSAARGKRGADPAALRVIAVDFRASRRSGWRGWTGLAAAAVVLVALTSSLTIRLMGAREGAPVAGAGATVRPTTALAAFRPAEEEYQSAVASLQAELAARRDRLSPQTIATIEENLRIIDQAIAEARAALEADPGNADLPLLLSGVYRKKLELLEVALQLPRTML